MLRLVLVLALAHALSALAQTENSSRVLIASLSTEERNAFLESERRIKHLAAFIIGPLANITASYEEELNSNLSAVIASLDFDDDISSIAIPEIRENSSVLVTSRPENSKPSLTSISTYKTISYETQTVPAASLFDNATAVVSSNWTCPEVIAKKLKENKKFSERYESYFSATKSKNETFDSLKEAEEFYYFFLPPEFSGVLKKERLPVKEWFKDLVWNATLEKFSSTFENLTLIENIVGEKVFFFISLLSDPQKKAMDEAITVLVIVSLFFGMLSLGCTMKFGEIVKHAKKPKGVAIALASQFVVMPAAAFGLTKLFDIGLFAQITVLVCGCCPGGNLSNILAYFVDGDMNLSILMTTCSSLLGLGVMPLNIYLYSQLIMDDALGEDVIPYGNIMINIALTLVPVFIGIVIGHFKPQWVNNTIKVGFFFMTTTSIAMFILSGLLFQDSFVKFFPIELVLICAILPFIGYTFGFFLALIGKESVKCCRTIMIETGCQNIQLCATVLMLAFNPLEVNILFLMPLIYMMFQLLEGFTIAFFMKIYFKCKRSKKTATITDSNNVKSKNNKKILEMNSKDYDQLHDRNLKQHEEAFPLKQPLPSKV